MDMSNPFISRFETGSGAEIFQIPVQAFPGFWVNVYLVLADPYIVLIDTASGFGDANDKLSAGITSLHSRRGETVRLENLTHILLTHAHIDHFGGLPFLSESSNAQLGVHDLDWRIVSNYEETLSLISRRLEVFFTEAGVSAERRAKLMELYRINKNLYHSVEVNFTYQTENMRLGPFEMLHVPGHTAGHVLIRLDDCVFTGDHILGDISPHQAPEQLTLSTGLAHYLESLEIAREWVESARLVLPGHKKEITNASSRIDLIKEVHFQRLAQVFACCGQPTTIQQVSRQLFANVSGYNVLLALEEAGAHIEYLHQRGYLRITNVDEVESAECPLPVLYQQARNFTEQPN
jgi:glyoxylase-like metal-dependent hydrolase (beta-lactamase superfamily II)